MHLLGFDTSNAVPEDEESTSPLEEETEKEVKLPLVVGGAMGGVILLLLLLAIVLMTVALVYCHAARKSAKNRGNDLRCTSNHPVGFNG